MGQALSELHMLYSWLITQAQRWGLLSVSAAAAFLNEVTSCNSVKINVRVTHLARIWIQAVQWQAPFTEQLCYPGRQLWLWSCVLCVLQIFIEHLQCARHCARHEGYRENWDSVLAFGSSASGGGREADRHRWLSVTIVVMKAGTGSNEGMRRHPREQRRLELT